MMWQVQTEDIDLSTRALLGGRVRIRFEPRCRSGELPPASFYALYRQRLRWALGWDQVTLQHLATIAMAPIGCMQKLGLYYILPLRWGVLLSASLNALVTPGELTAAAAAIAAAVAAAAASAVAVANAADAAAASTTAGAAAAAAAEATA